MCPLPEAVSRPHVSSLPTSPALASPPHGSGSDASRGPGAGTPRSPLSLSFPVCRAGPAVAPVPPGARAAGDLAQALPSHPRSARGPEHTRCRALSRPSHAWGRRASPAHSSCCHLTLPSGQSLRWAPARVLRGVVKRRALPLRGNSAPNEGHLPAEAVTAGVQETRLKGGRGPRGVCHARVSGPPDLSLAGQPRAHARPSRLPPTAPRRSPRAAAAPESAAVSEALGARAGRRLREGRQATAPLCCFCAAP